jgi:ATP-dependent Clp protease protease subunit
MNELYAQYTGQDLETIERAMDRDKFLSSSEAKEFGIVDEVFDKRPATGEGDTTHQANAA